MIDEQLQEQASLYVLDLLEPEEARAFEALLAKNGELRRHVDELSETVAQLAHAAPPQPLPPHLEARVLAAISGSKVVTMPKSFARAVWIPWAIAACLVVAFVIALADRQQLAQQLTSARQKNAESDAQLTRSRSEVADAQSRIATLAAEKNRAQQEVVELQQREADARAQMVTLAAARDEAANKLAQLQERERDRETPATDERRAGDESPEQLADRSDSDVGANALVITLSSKISTAPNATASIRWDSARQRGVLEARDVPPNSADRDYQLWIVDSRFAEPVSAGVFRVERPGATRYVFAPRVRIEAPSAFVVSLERKGGVPKAQGPTVLASK